jgi:predicted amidohydrolase YtcJ
MKFLIKWLSGGISCLLLALPAIAQDADLVLRNGIIWTVDESNPRAEAIAAGNGRIIYVGSDTTAEQYVGPNTRVVDLDGKFVTPGFYDNHVHFESTGERIRDVHERYAPGTWIVGGDWSAYETWAVGDVAEAGREVNPDDLYGNLFLPNKAMIDDFTGDRPVLVRRFDRKVYLANSAALDLAGIASGTPDPEGIAVERAANGEPTGALFNPVSGAVESTVLVRDNVRAFFSDIVPEPSRDQRIAETLEAWKRMAEVGVTSLSPVTAMSRRIRFMSIFIARCVTRT